MSSENPTDLDKEILKLIKWIRENYTINLWDNKPVWTKKGHRLYDDAIVLHYYKEQENAKH